MASAGARAIWESGGGAAAGKGVRGRSPPEAEGILLPKRANLSLSFKLNLNFAAICRKGPERRSGDQKKQERRSGAFRLETNPD